MAVKNLDQRVGVLVDVSNMYYSAKNLHNGAKVDFGAVLKDAVADRKLIRALAYVIKADIKEEQSFFDALERAGYEVKSKDLQIFVGGAKKGDWDVGISVDAIKLADKLDTVILVSGDGDYEPLINYLQENKGCYVEVYAFGRTASAKIIEKADEFHDLDDKPEEYLIQPRRRQTARPSTPIKGHEFAAKEELSAEAIQELNHDDHHPSNSGNTQPSGPAIETPRHTFFSTAVAKRTKPDTTKSGTTKSDSSEPTQTPE